MKLPWLRVAHRSALQPARPRRRKRLFEEYLVYAVLALLVDGIVWANEAEAPSVGRLLGGLVCAALGALLLFGAYVERIRERLPPEPEAAEADPPANV